MMLRGFCVMENISLCLLLPISNLPAQFSFETKEQMHINILNIKYDRSGEVDSFCWILRLRESYLLFGIQSKANKKSGSHFIF